MKWLKELFCKHNYEITFRWVGKVWTNDIKQCIKCNKVIPNV
jgi:hypothetical protein